MKIIPVLLLLVLACGAQEKSPVLSEKDKLSLRQAQVELLQTQQALQQTKEYIALQQAQAAISQAINGVYAEHKIKPGDYSLCDGPAGAPECRDVAARDLAFRAVPAKKEAAK